MELSPKMMQKIIEDTVNQTTSVLIQKLKNNGMIKSGNSTSFQKTETLLFNYLKFKRAVKDKQEQIESIRAEGMVQKSKSITSFTSNIGYDQRNEFEKAEDQIEKLHRAIESLNEHIMVIEAALNKVSFDPYYDIIRLRYFEERTREEIAMEFGVDETTITRNKNRLLSILKISLFTDDAMLEMMGVM